MSISVCSALKERIVATVMSLSGMNGYSFHGMSHSHLEGYAQEFHTMAPINLLARFTGDDLLDDTDFSSPKLRHAAGHEKRESICQATFMNLMVLRAILLHAARFTPGERRVLVSSQRSEPNRGGTWYAGLALFKESTSDCLFA